MAQIYTDKQGRQVYQMNGTVRDAKTGAVLNDSLPPLSEVTNTPAQVGATPSPVPSPNLTLPDTGGQSAPILTFADKLNQAVNLARKNRNQLSTGLMQPFQGTLAASDFNTILGNLNAASDTTAQDLIKTAKEQTTPQYDTLTGANGAIYQVQLDPVSGQVIGQPEVIVPGKSAGAGLSGPTSYQEWVLAGSPGTYQDWIQKSKAPTSAQETVSGYASRIEQADPIIGGLEQNLSSMNPITFEAQKRLPSYLQTAEYRQFDQAARNFINATLRRESGAVISPDEFENAYQQYLPRPNDDEQTLAQKRINRSIVYNSFKNAAGNAYQPLDELLGTTTGPTAPSGSFSGKTSSGLEYTVTP